jgi:hypothetical protein
VLDDWKLKLTFEGDEERLFDMKPYRFGVFARLEDYEYFKRVRIVDGSLWWSHNQALAYDMLYEKSKALATQ